MKVVSSLPAIAIAVVLAVEPAAAAAAVGKVAGVVEAVSACRKLEDSSLRLVCYDAATSRLDEARTKGDVVVVDREQVRSVRRQAFGFQLPSLALFSGSAKDDAVDRISAVVDHASQTVGGKWIMVTQDDAAWIQSDAQEIYADPHHGSTLVVSKGALGSFFCKVDGQSAFRCRRQG